MPTLEMKKEVAYRCPHCGKREHVPNAETVKALEDAMAGRNIVGPFATVDEMWASLMADVEALED